MQRGLIPAALAGVLLVGCQNLPIELPEEFGGEREPPAGEPVSRPRPQPVALDLLAFYARSGGLEPERLQQRAEALEPRASAPGCSEARLRSAILRLRLPLAQAGDVERRLAPCTGANVDPGRAHLAGLLGDLLAARRSGASAAAELEQQLAEAESRLQALAAENEQLREQLEGLKAIERSIQERDRSQGN